MIPIILSQFTTDFKTSQKAMIKLDRPKLQEMLLMLHAMDSVDMRKKSSNWGQAVILIRQNCNLQAGTNTPTIALPRYHLDRLQGNH